jgi:ribosomal protein S18 acetylase RimI-like enzyme
MVDISILHTATQEEFADVSALLQHLHEGSTSTYTPDFERFKSIVADTNIDFVVARDVQKIVGMAMLYTICRVDEVAGHIDDVVVDDAYRGQGIATKLMEKLISIARERGHKYIDLTSRPSREAANHLYQKLGFQIRETNPYRLKL